MNCPNCGCNMAMSEYQGRYSYVCNCSPSIAKERKRERNRDEAIQSLVEALQNFIEVVEAVDHGVYADSIDQAKEAIRKATQ